MNKLYSKKTFALIFSVFCIILLCFAIVPRLHRATASGSFTVSNLTFDPTTGVLDFDYSSSDDFSTAPDGSNPLNIEDTSGAGTTYWLTNSGVCTSSHCHMFMMADKSDSGVSSVKLHFHHNTIDDYTSSINYPLPEPTTFSSQNWSAGIRAYQVNATSGQTTTSTTFTNMTNGTQSITLNTKSLVYVDAHANAYTTGGKAYIRTAYNSGGTDTAIGTQGYTNTTSDGQSITAGGVVTLAAGTYTIEMQDEVTSNTPSFTATYNQPGMSIMIIPSP